MGSNFFINCFAHRFTQSLQAEAPQQTAAARVHAGKEE